MTILSIKHISKAFDGKKALDDISFEVDEGEIVALLGPSGSGKSTLLMVISGLETPDTGDVIWDDHSILGIPPHLRGFGLMFQDFALFPHMNVFANVAFGLRMAHMDQEKINARVQEMLTLVGLSDFSKRDVNTLSGGEQQRIALARALAPHPILLMVDEPLGSLDRNLRERLVIELQDILKQMHQTAIYVTHDQEEAFTIADRIILLNSGRIEQIGTPQEIYSNPASLFVARFLEMTNIFSGNISIMNGKRHVSTDLGIFPVDTTMDGSVCLLIRSDMVQIDDEGPIILKGIINDVSFRGGMKRITLLVNNHPIVFDVPSMVRIPDTGGELTISIDPSIAVKVFPFQ